jgi:hypothetical protein
MSLVGFTCRILIAIVFCTSFATKVKSPPSYRAFTASVRGMTSLRSGAASFVTAAIVLGEGTVVICLVMPFAGGPITGFALAGLLLLCFGAAIWRSTSRSSRVPCRCFGLSNQPVSQVDLARNALLLAACVLGILSGTASQVPQSGARWFVTAFAALYSALLLINFDEVTWSVGRVRRHVVPR